MRSEFKEFVTQNPFVSMCVPSNAKIPARGRFLSNMYLPCHRAIYHGQQVTSWHRACSLGHYIRRADSRSRLKCCYFFQI